MDTLLQDLRFGFRILRKKPALAAVAIATLGLGIGANVAVFTLINAVLFQPLPVEDSLAARERLYRGQHGRDRGLHAASNVVS